MSSDTNLHSYTQRHIHTSIVCSILIGMTTVEETFTEVNVYHDLRLCPGDGSCICSDFSLCSKVSSSLTSSTSL